MCGNSSLMFTVNGGTIEQNAAFLDAFATTSSAVSTSTSATTSATISSTQMPSTVATCSAAADSNRTCPSHIGAYAGIGAGLGVPLLVALIALAFTFMQLRKHKKQHVGSAVKVSNNEQSYLDTPPTMSNTSHGGGYYSPIPPYKPTAPVGELPTYSNLGNQGRTELMG